MLLKIRLSKLTCLLFAFVVCWPPPSSFAKKNGTDRETKVRELKTALESTYKELHDWALLLKQIIKQKGIHKVIDAGIEAYRDAFMDPNIDDNNLVWYLTAALHDPEASKRVSWRNYTCDSWVHQKPKCKKIWSPFIETKSGEEERRCSSEDLPDFWNIVMLDYPEHDVDGAELVYDPFTHMKLLNMFLKLLNCTLLIFYANWCEQSALMAPHFHAVSRAFPNISIVTVDISQHPYITAKYGIYGTPTLFLIQAGIMRARLSSDNMTATEVAAQLEKYTDQIAISSELTLKPIDFKGPIPVVPTSKYDGYDVILCWIFIALSTIYLLRRKNRFRFYQ